MIVTPTKNLSIPELKRAFMALDEIRLAVLFGSRATGSAHPFSDYDFGVVIESEDPWTFGRLWIEIADRLGIGDEQLDLVDLKRALKGLKKAIAGGYIVLKGREDELLRILGSDSQKSD
jgi:predicted nucleotidyltransferase